MIRRGETTAVKLRQGVTVPQEETLTAICKLFGVTPGWLLFGIAPKYAAPGATASVGAAPRQGSRGHPGLNAWINGTAEGRNTDTAERAWLRGCPWPEEIARAPNEAYSLALQAYRIAMHAREDEAG